MQKVVNNENEVNNLILFRMVVMSNINGQFTPVLQQNSAQQILTNDKLKSQQQNQAFIQQVSEHIIHSFEL